MPFLLFSFLRCRLCCHLDAHPGKPPHFRCDRRSEGGNPQRPVRHCSQHNRRTAGNNNEYGQFVIEVPSGNISLSVQGQFIKPYQCELPTAVSSEDLKIEIEYLIPPIHHSIVITASALNVGIENLTDKQYYETQNFFESRVSPTAEAFERIHGTPGYPFGITVGLTFRIAGKR
jgi:hypothetical protein